MAEDLDQIVDNLKQPSSWLRLPFMIGFAILLYLVIVPVMFVLMGVQALFVLITGDCNSNLKYLGAALAEYVLQILQFISYNSEQRPFPFSDFPAAVINAEEDGSDESDESVATPSASTGASAAKRKTAVRKKAAARKSTKTKAAGSNESAGDGAAKQ